MNRRQLIKLPILGSILAGTPFLSGQARADDINNVASSDNEWLALTETQWQERLTKEQFAVLRLEATERPGSSVLNEEKREGVYHCAGCDLPLFHSRTKYESGTGWPSFYDVIEGAVGTKTDYMLIWPRTEYHCVRCKGHQGHVFGDGPKPTGLRYCNNGVALKFRSA